MRLLVDFLADSAILFSVREIKNNMKNTMTMTEIRRHFNLRNRREALAKATCNDWHEVTCRSCGADETITGEEVGQWDHGIENFECAECE